MDSTAAALGSILFANPDSYRIEALPGIVLQLREAQTMLEARYANLRKLASEPARPAPTSAKAATPQRKRGRPTVRTNGHAPDAPIPLPLEDTSHGEQTAQAS